MKNCNYGIIVVDMLNDFVSGKLKCDRAQRIIPNIKKLIVAARKLSIPVIYSNDAHLKGVDHELKLWGDHAIIGTKGAQVIDDLKPSSKDYIVNKRRYSGFFQTDLDILLRELNINTLIIVGLHANMCVRHTTADGFQLGYKIIIPEDGVDCFEEKDYIEALKYLKDVYGAKIIKTNELVKVLK